MDSDLGLPTALRNMSAIRIKSRLHAPYNFDYLCWSACDELYNRQTLGVYVKWYEDTMQDDGFSE